MSEPLFHSPQGLYPFQARSIEQDYDRTRLGGGMVVVWDPGVGKSVFGMKMSTLLQEKEESDLTIVLCEKGKLGEWVEDFKTFTRQDVRLHHGPKRMRELENNGLPRVLVTTYETAKADLVKFIRPNRGKRGTKIVPGPLFEAIEGKRILWLNDESAAKLGNRTSDLYKAFDWTYRGVRKANPAQVIFGLTATPMETGFENAFNQGRLFFPEVMPKVKEFEDWFVASRHPVYGTPRYNQATIGEFAKLFQARMDRRRKTDPEIMEQFPKKTEQFVSVEMGRDQARLYDDVLSLQAETEEPIPGLWLAARLIAGHPAAVPLAARNGSSKLLKMLVQEWGEEIFLNTPSAKEAELITRLRHIVHEAKQKAVIFTFFGQTILPVLEQSLTKQGFTVYTNHGGLSAHESERRRREFRTSEVPCIYLTSDAGSRGINLPEATELFEFEGSLTYANHTQRIDRIHRISSTSPSVTCTTMVANGTVEDAIAKKVADRNKESDILLGDDDAGENFMTAEERYHMLMLSRMGRQRSKK